MSIRIRVYYENEEELKGIEELLKKKIISCKVPKSQTGKFKRAYIKIKK